MVSLKSISCLLLVSSFHLENALGYNSTDGWMIESCEDFTSAVKDTSNGHVYAMMHPFADVECLNHTTFNLTSGNSLEIYSSESLENHFGSSGFTNVRLHLSNGSSFVIENNVFFSSEENDFSDLPDVNGGAFFVEEGSEVRFLNDLSSRYIGVRSQTVEDSDFPDHQNSGGFLYNNGKFVVEGKATFRFTENSGGGEGSPGDGGIVWNNGTVLFKGGVEMTDVSILDDEGGDAAGFYNLGVVRISGDSKFSRMFAETAGGIYNGKDAKFIVRNGASVLFNECKASDGVAGAVFNRGYMKFTGPVLIVESRSYYQGGAIVVDSGGEMKFSKDLVVFGTQSGDVGSPIYIREGSSVNLNKKKTSFIANTGEEGSTCFSLFDENTGECL